MNKIKFLAIAFSFVALLVGNTVSAQTITEGVTIIELTQVLGSFESNTLNLKPGKYQFKVTNKNVDHEVGFVIQAAKDKDGDVMKTAITNSFSESMIAEGGTATTGIVELKAGEYVYSCPLNPTPKYSIIVK